MYSLEQLFAQGNGHVTNLTHRMHPARDRGIDANRLRVPHHVVTSACIPVLPLETLGAIDKWRAINFPGKLPRLPESGPPLRRS